MPYDTNSDLPENVKEILPNHAQNIYREAFNAAWEEYKNKDDRFPDRTREETAHAVAWSAVKKKYKKTEKGNWEEI